jgi:hypothetical protein
MRFSTYSTICHQPVLLEEGEVDSMHAAAFYSEGNGTANVGVTCPRRFSKNEDALMIGSASYLGSLSRLYIWHADSGLRHSGHTHHYRLSRPSSITSTKDRIITAEDEKADHPCTPLPSLPAPHSVRLLMPVPDSQKLNILAMMHAEFPMLEYFLCRASSQAQYGL